MMMQSKRKKPTTINIDKINGIESENEIDGYVITDEMKERFNNGFSEALKKLKSIGITNVTQGLSFSVAGIQDGINKATSQLAKLGLNHNGIIGIQIIEHPFKGLIESLGNYFTPERIRELDKQWTIFKQKRDLSKKSYESECEHFQKETGLYFDFKHFFIWLRKYYERDFYIFSEKEFRDKVLEFYCIEELSRRVKRENFINNHKNQLLSPAPKEIAVGHNTFNFDKEIESLMKSENQFHRGLPMDFVINHFKVFYENNRRTEYLSKESFVSFIKRGFLNDDTQPIQKVNFNTGEKGLVILRFYEFFDNAVKSYSHPNKKANFVNLILRCFDNLGDNNAVFELLKPNKTRQTW